MGEPGSRTPWGQNINNIVTNSIKIKKIDTELKYLTISSMSFGIKFLYCAIGSATVQGQNKSDLNETNLFRPQIMTQL